MPSARSIWRCGTSREKCRVCRYTSCWAAWSAIIASATTRPASFRASPTGMSIKERAHATIEAGYRAFRFGAMDLPANTTYNTRERLNHLRDECTQAREGVGKDGDWVIDFHQRFDLADAIRGCNADRRPGSVLRRRPGSHRSLPARPADPAQESKRSPGGGRGVGQPVGLQQTGRGSRYRFRPRHATQCRRHYRDDEDCRHLRNSLRRHRSALHRTHRDRGAGQQPGHFLCSRS